MKAQAVLLLATLVVNTFWLCYVEDSGAEVERRSLVSMVPGSSPVMSGS